MHSYDVFWSTHAHPSSFFQSFLIPTAHYSLPVSHIGFFFLFFFKLTKSTQWCQCEKGIGPPTYWRVSRLQGTGPLRKTDCPTPATINASSSSATGGTSWDPFPHMLGLSLHWSGLDLVPAVTAAGSSYMQILCGFVFSNQVLNLQNTLTHYLYLFK